MIKELIFKLITSRKLIKVYHRGCEGHVGYVYDAGKPKRDTGNFYFLDGRHPNKSDKICIPCVKCKKNLSTMGDVVLL